MKTAVIYARFSSDRQTEQSIEGQVRVCNDYAERNDILIVSQYIDRATTGTNDNREAFQKMMKDSDKKAWDYVLVYKLDRFSRNKFEMAMHRKRLKDNGIKILSAMENIPDSPEGILLESLLEGMNQYYSEELSQKTRRGQRETRIKGLHCAGKLNYGYYTEKKKVFIHSEEGPVVKEIFERYAAGERGNEIAISFAERGILYRGKPFTAANIYVILHSEKYTGRYEIHGEVYDNIYPKIIDKELFERCKAKIDANRYGNHIPVFRKQMMDEFLQKLHSVAYRVTKAECLDLPQTTEEIRTVELESKAMKLYKQLEKESFAELSSSEVSAVNVLTKMLRLSQMTGGYLTDDAGSITSVSTAKLDALSDILDTMLTEDRKLVIMARFVPELDGIQELLKRKQIGYASVRGGVSDRAEEIRRFQEDADCKVFVGQIAAAGLGITLTAASTMVFYSLDYSMSNFEQAKARIHRVSQTENCLYIYLIAKNTVDAKILRSLRDKVDLARTLVDDYRNGINPFQEGV